MMMRMRQGGWMLKLTDETLFEASSEVNVN